jgi:hypothetical protein
MAKKYGLPYQGSKSKLAERIVALLPPATHLYDIFAGGCAITHAALLSGKFKEIHANDISDSVTLFEDALNGKYENESRWISREDFFRLKDSDPYVRIVWSFGNNQRGYLYSREIEPYKKAVHEMLYAATPNERRLKFKTVIREMEKLGLLTRGGQDRFRCESAERAESIAPLRFLTDNQAEEAKQRIGSVNMNVCRRTSVASK